MNTNENRNLQHKVFSNATNPFLAPLVQHLSTDNLAKRLKTSPFDDIDITSLNMQEKLDLLDMVNEEFFEPTTTSDNIATRLYRLIRSGYINRDPRNYKVRALTMEIASHYGGEMKDVPWYSTFAKGMTTYGITGLGKSFEIERALKILPKFIEHGASEEVGWANMKQVVWLKVGMSHDGSLGGLLFQILCELDAILDTEYSKDKALVKSSNEKLAVKIGIIFRNHGLGVLVIDEIQKRNFEGNGRGGLAATFFLRLLNFGIPVVLVGNPLGFDALYLFSQDVRRIGSGGTIAMHPHEIDELDWTDCIVRAYWGINLLPDPYEVSDHDERVDLLYQYSGGIRAYACRIIVASQRMALDIGAPCVTKEIMEAVFLGDDFSDSDRGIIAGFRDKDPLILSNFEDIPWEYYRDNWASLLNKDKKKENDDTSEDKSSENKKNETPHKPVAQTDLEQCKKTRTRKANAASARANAQKSLPDDDMRTQGIQKCLLKGFDSLISN